MDSFSVDYLEDEDVVFLQLTSEGDDEMHVAVDLTPEEAAELSLDLWGEVPDHIREVEADASG